MPARTEKNITTKKNKQSVWGRGERITAKITVIRMITTRNDRK